MNKSDVNKTDFKFFLILVFLNKNKSYLHLTDSEIFK